MSTELPDLPEVERLSPRVVRILGGNRGKFTLQGTNTYLIGTGPERILIDTGEGRPSWLTALRRVLESEHARVSQVLLTHWHPDHVGGTLQVKEVCPEAQIYQNDAAGSRADRQTVQDGQTFRTEGATLHAVHCPGHTVDHMAFVLDDEGEEEGAMFTGDNVLGHGTAVFEELGTYLRSLKKMKARCGGRAYPGHGAVIEDGHGRIEEYIRHRAERESQVLQVLARHGHEHEHENGCSAMDIVRVVYVDYPSSLHGPAAKGVAQILEKLKDEGRVSHACGGDGNEWVLTARL